MSASGYRKAPPRTSVSNTASGKPSTKILERVAFLKAFRVRCDVSGSLILCASWEARAALCPESNNWHSGAVSEVFSEVDLIGTGAFCDNVWPGGGRATFGLASMQSI